MIGTTRTPWIVRGEAPDDADPVTKTMGIEPAEEGTVGGGWPYFIRQDKPMQPGYGPRWIASGIQHLPDARLICRLANAEPGPEFDSFDLAKAYLAERGWRCIHDAAYRYRSDDGKAEARIFAMKEGRALVIQDLPVPHA